MPRSSRERLSWLAITILLGLELRFDRLRLLVPSYKEHFQADSDQLVYQALLDPSRGLFDPMLRPSGEDYTSQFGLQGIVMAAFGPGTTSYGAMRLVTAFLLAAVIATAVIACRRAWGRRAAAVLLALLTLSPWLNAFGPSTYWQAWTLFLPTLVPLLTWNRLGDGRRKWTRGGLLIAGLVLFKCLCGYEYISTVLLGVAGAVAFHEFRGRVDRRLVTRLCAAMGAGVAGFATAMAVHAVQLVALYGDASRITSRAEERTFTPSNISIALPRVENEAGAVTRWVLERNEVLGVWLHHVIGYAQDPAITLPGPASVGLGPRPYGIPVYVLVAAFAVLAWHARRSEAEDGPTQRRLAVAAGLGLAGASSWLVLAYGHMIHHPHINAIVFYISFLPFVFAMIAVRVETVSRRLWPTAADAGTARAESHREDLAPVG